jgi:hypothetical protein
VLFVLVSPETFRTQRKTALYWLLPIVFGVILVSPFLATAVPTYLTDNSSAPGVQGVNDINSAILSTRIMPLSCFAPLSHNCRPQCSQRYNNDFSVFQHSFFHSLLSLILTQSYSLNSLSTTTDFLHNVASVIFIAVLIDHGSEFFAVFWFLYSLSSQMRNQNHNKILCGFSI